MANAYVGEAYRIHYIAKEFQSGLTDVRAHVYKPNGLLLGPYSFIEILIIPGVGDGFYYFDFLDADVQGNYLFIVYSSSQGTKAAQQVFFVTRPDIATDHLKTSVDSYHAIDVGMHQEILEGTSAIQDKTNKLQFNSSNDIKATLDGEVVNLNSETMLMLKTTLGLSHHNYRIFEPSYNSDGKLISCTVKLYETNLDLLNNTSPIKVYNILAEYNSSKLMTSYRMIEA
jgi:hypothetical protein